METPQQRITTGLEVVWNAACHISRVAGVCDEYGNEHLAFTLHRVAHDLYQAHKMIEDGRSDDISETIAQLTGNLAKAVLHE